MNEEIKTLKIVNYENFKCTADKCKFTCCEGWDINVDKNTYNNWKKESHKYDYILENVKKCGSKFEYFINKETNEVCPFLDEKGLCQIVKNHGEDQLSLACHMFPRIENVFDDRKELSLSCACPEVVELIGKINGKINSPTVKNANSDLFEIKVRETLIDIIQQEGFALENKLIICFEILSSNLEDENLREDNLLLALEKYNDRNFIEERIKMYKEIEFNIEDSIEEINNLFLDIAENYKEVSIFDILLKDISHFAKSAKPKTLASKWCDFKSLFEQHNQLIQNCIVSKVFADCVDDDIEEMTISFQMIILEYLLVRYDMFLKYCMYQTKEVNVEDVKDYITAFSRIIGNNREAVTEFFEEGFDDAILEIGYLCFIALF